MNCVGTRPGESKAALLSIASAFAGALTLLASPAYAQDCHIGPAAVPLELISNHYAVTALINDVPEKLFVDTGSITVITRSTSNQLNLPTDELHRTTMLGVLSNTDAGQDALVTSFTLGNLSLPLSHVPVAPADFSPGTGGLIGVDLLFIGDLELDIPHGSLTVHSADPVCTGHPLDWNEPYQTIPVQRSQHTRSLLVPVLLNGIQLLAVLDTGSVATVISRSGALKAGITDDTLNAGPTTKAIDSSGNVGELHVARFSSLSIGDEELHDISLNVTDHELPDGDLIIGLDYIHSRKLWVSASTGQMFVMPPQPRVIELAPK